MHRQWGNVLGFLGHEIKRHSEIRNKDDPSEQDNLKSETANSQVNFVDKKHIASSHCQAV
jgi:hypothetical protein